MAEKKGILKSEKDCSSDKKVDVVCDKRLNKYFGITEKALKMVKAAERDVARAEEAADFLDMAERYFSDAKHFRSNGNYVLAFAAVNYAHAWLDAAARLKLFKVSDSELFAAD